MDGKSTMGRIATLIALGFVVAAGILGTIFSHENAAAILGFCTLSCVPLLAILQKTVADGVQAVHTMVDGQRTAMQERIDQLEKLIMKSMEKGEPVPASSVVEVSKVAAATAAAAVKKANGKH